MHLELFTLALQLCLNASRCLRNYLAVEPVGIAGVTCSGKMTGASPSRRTAQNMQKAGAKQWQDTTTASYDSPFAKFQLSTSPSTYDLHRSQDRYTSSRHCAPLCTPAGF